MSQPIVNTYMPKNIPRDTVCGKSFKEVSRVCFDDLQPIAQDRIRWTWDRFLDMEKGSITAVNRDIDSPNLPRLSLEKSQKRCMHRVEDGVQNGVPIRKLQ